MQKPLSIFTLIIFFCGGAIFAQKTDSTGHTNQNKFRQLYQEFATPNQYRTASGAPGPEYYQNEADYDMAVVLNDENQTLSGHETITYHNNSPEDLTYLWVQLDQNIRERVGKTQLHNPNKLPTVSPTEGFVSKYIQEPFDGGFNIESVAKNGKALNYTINQTMMRVDLPKPLKGGKSYSFSIKWNYNINDHVRNRGRSGYEFFEEDGNYAYCIAQFFPRMAVYDDVEGWQNQQFWGAGEFALPFGKYKVKITVPADHILEATGKLQNRKAVFSKKMLSRYKKAENNPGETVQIVTQAEAEANEKGGTSKTKTWEFKADKVRDFAFTSSRKYIWDVQSIKIGENQVMAETLYPKEGNPLWSEYGIKAVAHTLKIYSKHTFDYPYPKAIAVHAKNQGMEYPMICWNHGRPDADGSYSEYTKFRMIGVIIHEVGHNFMPMIVNSDERQWGWLDEGLNSFLEYLTEQDFGKTYPESLGDLDNFPSRRGAPGKVLDYMRGDQRKMTPIMSNPENVFQLGNNAYTKTTAALNILRSTVMGKKLFDYAFKTYAHRWMFKHPTPEDFFRTMEDASAVDLDWFWRGWFYTTDYVDIGVKNVKAYRVTDQPTKKGKEILKRQGVDNPNRVSALYIEEENATEKSNMDNNVPTLERYINDNFTPEQRKDMKVPKHFYQITFEKPGGLVMPLIVEYSYADGSSERITYPVQIWRHNDKAVNRVLATDKTLVKVMVDPDSETADVNTDNNTWTKE